MGDANGGVRKRTHLMTSDTIACASSVQAGNNVMLAWNRKDSSDRLTRRVKLDPTTSNAFIEAAQEPRGESFYFVRL